jgi:hypothetical protein
MWIVSGMGAVIFAVLNLIFSMQDKTEKVKWFRFTSMALTALTLCAAYSDSAGRVSAEDWGALMDIMPTMSTVLWICTGSSIILNSVTLFKEKK